MRLSRHYTPQHRYPSPAAGLSSQVTDRNRIFYALWATGVFLVILWGAFLGETLLGWDLRAHGGIRPREWSSLTGILTYPLLHGDWEHLWNNTASFFTLNTLLFYFYRSIAFRVWLGMYGTSGLLLWLFGNSGNHIGASGMVYALAAFLFLSGVIRDRAMLKRVSLVVVFLYGGMVWWMLPVEEHISWAGHTAGALVGVLWAVAFRKHGPVNDPVLPEETGPPPAWWLAAHPEFAEATEAVDVAGAAGEGADAPEAVSTDAPESNARNLRPVGGTEVTWHLKRDDSSGNRTSNGTPPPR
jgi:membrane associated rhomboid family serine protease